MTKPAGLGHRDPGIGPNAEYRLCLQKMKGSFNMDTFLSQPND